MNKRMSAPQSQLETKVDLVDSVNLTGPNEKQIENNEQEQNLGKVEQTN